MLTETAISKNELPTTSASGFLICVVKNCAQKCKDTNAKQILEKFSTEKCYMSLEDMKKLRKKHITREISLEFIAELLPSQTKELANVLARAVMNSPWWNFFCGKKIGPERYSMVRWFHQRVVDYAVRYGRCWVILSSDKTRILGGVIWQSPFESGVKIGRMIKIGMASLPKIFGAITSITMLQIQDHLDKFENKLEPEPHWWIEIMGVEPDEQNQGFGSSVLQPIFREADRTRVKCVTCTPNERNIRFLERNGFELIDETLPPHNAPKVYFFIRNPKPINE